MKLRIRGSSLRLRLSQGEVHTLAEHGAVEDRVEFPGGTRLVYRVRIEKNIPEISASYNMNLIEVLVPEALAGPWCRSDGVALSTGQSGAAGELRVAVEKDFACLAPREGEDDADSFPHPHAGGGRTC